MEDGVEVAGGVLRFIRVVFVRFLGFFLLRLGVFIFLGIEVFLEILVFEIVV